MSLEKFRSLIIQYCELVEIEQPSLILEGCPLIVDDVVFSVLYDEEKAPDYISVYCDFGELPKPLEQGIDRMILTANSLLYMTQGSCLARSPKNGHVVLAINVDLEDLSAQSFRGMLEDIKQTVQQCKKNTLDDWLLLLKHFPQGQRQNQI